MNENSKCDISFIYADAWHATQNKSFRSDLWTSRTLKMCQYQNPWVTKPVLCPFLDNWKYFKIVVRVFRAQLGLTWVWKIQVWPCLSVKDIDEQCEFSQSPRWAIRVSTILTQDRMDFDAIFQQINLNLSRKLYALTLVDFRTSWRDWLFTIHKKKIPEILVEKFWSVRTVRVVYHLPKISWLSRRARLDSSYNMKLVRIGHFHDDDVWLELPAFISPSLSY